MFLLVPLPIQIAFSKTAFTSVLLKTKHQQNLWISLETSAANVIEALDAGSLTHGVAGEWS